VQSFSLSLVFEGRGKTFEEAHSQASKQIAKASKASKPLTQKVSLAAVSSSQEAVTARLAWQATVPAESLHESISAYFKNGARELLSSEEVLG
jgi:hypothetical protein